MTALRHLLAASPETATTRQAAAILALILFTWFALAPLVAGGLLLLGLDGAP